MKTFVHKKTGEEITYKDGCIYFGRTVIEAEPNLEFWQEVVKRKPLFKTFDGVEVFEGDRYYYFRFHSWSYDMSIANEKFYSQDKLSKNSLYFSAKEKVEEYILMNKPCLSLQEAMNNNNASLKELVKSRL